MWIQVYLFPLMFLDMSQFGLSSSNSHWGYGGAGAYPAYLPSCAAPAASQFNPPSLGFASTVPDQTPSQEFSTNNTGKTITFYES